MGPLMIDLAGVELTSEDAELLQHPLVGGIILFSRNYQSPEQVSLLASNIRKASKEPILIAVDHEGGRVQRFRDQFSTIPAMYELWGASGKSLESAKIFAFHCGYLMAAEVIAVGLDISFAPVLDINNISDVIGDRAFHHQPEHVTLLSREFINGMKLAGMKSTAKHFPGHGSVKEDSHVAIPVDKRAKSEVFQQDMQPFKQLITEQLVDAIMPAHVIFPDIDQDAVGFSRYWLQDILRQSLNFNGVIFSDDLTMEGASYIGGYVERAEAAQQAGCDMLLVCNNREASIEVIDNANLALDKQSELRMRHMLATQQQTWQKMQLSQQWQQSFEVVSNIHELVKN